MSKEMPISGLVAVAITPMTESGAIDDASLERLIDFYIECRVSGLALLGVMGEANRMTDNETRKLVDLAMDAVDGRVPVIVGVSDASLARVSELSRYASEAGAAGVLLQPLSGLAADRDVAGYFSNAQRAIGPEIPICVQDFPKANGVHISADAWRMIVRECESVVMLKAEDEPGLEKLSTIRRAEADGQRRATILTGNNGIHLIQEMARGADGAMTGFAFPDVLVRVIDLFKTGKADEAEDLFDTYLPVNRHELRMGISIRKEIFRKRGIIASAYARSPAPKVSQESDRELQSLLLRLESRSGVPITSIVPRA